MNIYNNMDGLEQENLLLKHKIQELEERLKKYTNGDNHKRYYEKNKDKVKEIGANYLNKLKEENPEKLKEYRRTYYLKKKEKVKQNDQNNNNI
jgi:predicted MPP superfamily phosphohydrolase